MTQSSLTEAEKPNQPNSSDVKACPNCGSVESWGTASWCPDCGYYPALGGTSLRSAEEAQAAASQAAWEPSQDGPANLLEAIPSWAWTALAGVFLIFLANIAARLILPLKDSHRTLLTLLEFSAGMIMAGIAQGSAYLFAACRSDKFAPFDFFMKPIEIWKPTFQTLPEGNRRVCGLVWGISTIVAGLFIMSGFALNSLFDDWGFEEYKAPTPEVGIQRFKEAEPVESSETRCVIIGYIQSEQGELESLVLGSAPQGRLAYVGLLSQTEIPEENRAEILKKLQSVNELESCYVKQGVPLNKATWIEPKVLCLVEHQSWTSQYRLQQPTFKNLVNPEDAAKETKGETN